MSRVTALRAKATGKPPPCFASEGDVNRSAGRHLLYGGLHLYFEKGNDLVLGSHMLEVCPSSPQKRNRSSTFSISVLVVRTSCPPDLQYPNRPSDCRQLDYLGDRYRLLVNCIDTVKTPHPCRNCRWRMRCGKRNRICQLFRSVDPRWWRAPYRLQPCADLNDMRQFAEMHDIEITVIDTTPACPRLKTHCAGTKCITDSSLSSHIRYVTPDATLARLTGLHAVIL